MERSLAVEVLQVVGSLVDESQEAVLLVLQEERSAVDVSEALEVSGNSLVSQLQDQEDFFLQNLLQSDPGTDETVMLRDIVLVYLARKMPSVAAVPFELDGLS